MNDRQQRPEWLSGLLEADAYTHETGSIELIETHISWLILTGAFVYKIKKPVSLGFADFSSLEKRRHFCHEEVRLNRRYAPELYLGVATVSGSPGAPRIDNDGPLLDYAVKMHQFDQNQLLSRLAARGGLSGSHIDDLARIIASLHRQARIDSTIAPNQGVERAREPVSAIIDSLVDFPGLDNDERLAQIRRWISEFVQQHGAHFAHRAAAGRWRECHGDLHLDNIVVWRGRVTPFDGIEFNPALNWIDVMSDLAFTLMDLERKGCPGFAFRLLNAYLQDTGDYSGLSVLDFYLVYRILVRARVRSIRFEQGHREGEILDAISPHLEQAAAVCAGRGKALMITHGLSGSGKSFWAARLCRRLGAIHLRSDCERRWVRQPESSRYTRAARERVYDRLEELARGALEAGYPVVVDATFLDRRQRDRFRELADALGVPFRILWFSADPEVLKKRVACRQAEGRDPSEADVEVLERQLEHYHPPGADEAGCLMRFDTGADLNVDDLAWAVAGALSDLASD